MLRGFLLLMPLKQPNAEVNQLGCGCDALFCSKDGCKAVDKRLEDTGLHQRYCAFTSTIAATMLKETMAGLVVQASPVHNVRPEGITEPPTNQFIPGSTGAHITTISDKTVDPRTKIEAAGLLEKLMTQLAQPAQGKSDAAILAALKRLEPNINATGARYDLLAIPQDNSDKSILVVDFVTTNEASAVWRDKHLEFLLNRPLETVTKSAFGIKAPNAPAFEATENLKGAKYQYIERLATMAYQLGLTERLPDFRYAIVTNRGHLNADMVYLVDWLAEQRTKHAVSTGLQDSISFPHRKALFRNEVLDRLTIYLLKVNSLWGNLDEAARGNKTLRKNNAGVTAS
jgi:hypothetical protein